MLELYWVCVIRVHCFVLSVLKIIREEYETAAKEQTGDGDQQETLQVRYYVYLYNLSCNHYLPVLLNTFKYIYVTFHLATKRNITLCYVCCLIQRMLVTDEGVDDDYTKPMPLLKAVIIEAVNEFITELETR